MQLPGLEVQGESPTRPVVFFVDVFTKIAAPNLEQIIGRDPPVGFVCAIVEEEDPDDDGRQRERQNSEADAQHEAAHIQQDADKIGSEVEHFFLHAIGSARVKTLMSPSENK